MKSVNYNAATQPFSDTFTVIANAFGARRSAAGREGATSRLGRWLMRKQMDGVAPHLARAQDVFERLDHWMWRQQSRQVESYLAGSADVFELERRLRALERGPRGTVL